MVDVDRILCDVSTAGYQNIISELRLYFMAIHIYVFINYTLSILSQNHFYKFHIEFYRERVAKCCTECFYLQYGTLPSQVLILAQKKVYSPYLLPPRFWNYFTLQLHSQLQY